MLSVILLSLLMILLSTLSVIRSDLWQQLELSSELESILQYTVDLSKKWLVDFSTGKAQPVSFDWSNNTATTHVKMDESFLEENHLLRCWVLGLTVSTKLDWGSFIISIAKDL